MPKSQQASISPPFVASVVTNTQNFDEISLKFRNNFILVWNKEVQRNPYPKHNHYVTLIKSKNNYLLPRAKKLCN